MGIDNDIVKIVDKFNLVIKCPETFISANENLIRDVKHLLKESYDFTKQEESDSLKSSNALPELIIQDFDLEQIWQQVELQNDAFFDQSVTLVSRLAVAKDRLVFPEIKQSSDEDDDNIDANDDDIREDNEQNSILEEGENKSQSEDAEEEDLLEGDEFDTANDEKQSNNNVEDNFFNLREMNDFLASEEKKLDKKLKKDSTADSDLESEESDIDMFEANSDNEDYDNDFEGNDKLNNPRYKDFFGTKTQQMEQEREERENNDSDDCSDADKEEEVIEDTNQEYKVKSTLELREQRLGLKIKEIESAAVGVKPWQLIGEVTAEKRPQNSLLQEVLEFDLIRRPAPVITEETTHVLEDVIRQRIKDKAFDDVERKEKPVETALEFKKKLMLNQEKSKESLAQIYEKEFVQQREALNPDDNEKEEEEPQLHQEIKTLMKGLFTKLDALSNFHFTPKPAMPELKVVSNLPAISMEEVAPVVASDAALLAPEEIKSKINGNIISKGERTSTDKKRERRKKKQKQRIHANEKLKRENAKVGIANKYNKEKSAKLLKTVTKGKNVDKMNENLAKSIKSSSAFFSQLEEEVKSHITNKRKTKTNKTKCTLDAKKIKL